MTEITGGAVLAAMLEREGVENFFGIVDGTYTQLFAHCVERGIQMISPRHEAVAAHMAGAYARLTGRLGVCIASNGPGVANMLPGVAVENAEGNRVLLLTSSRRTGITYPDRGGAYQCFDHVAVIRGMSKWSETVHAFDRIPELMRQALRACFTGRPGVVHLDVPENLINGAGEAPALGRPARVPANGSPGAECRRRRARRADPRGGAPSRDPRRERRHPRPGLRRAGRSSPSFSTLP